VDAVSPAQPASVVDADPHARPAVVTDAASPAPAASVQESAPNASAPSPSGALSALVARLQPLQRGVRRVAFFVRSLARTVLPARWRSGVASALPSRAGQHSARVLASVTSKLPALAPLAALSRRARSAAATPKPRRKLPSLVELRSTLSMLASSEPPQLTPPSEPRPLPVPASRQVPFSPLPHGAQALSGALDADELIGDSDADLDELLFGDSEPGLDTADEALGQPPTAAASHDLLVALAQLAHDTSPGLLEAPDTLPG
jgi:hypothetical protein